MTSPTEYPLAWPYNRPRSNLRPMKSQFKTSLNGALQNVRDSLRRFGSDTNKKVTNIIVSSNCSLGNNSPDDSGVAVYFTWDGEQRCIPVDRYTKVACNLQAIHHILEARRTEYRHGGLLIVKASFEGHKALPAPCGHRSWTEVLSLPPSANSEQIKARKRELSHVLHPDKGGDAEAFKEMTAAADQALREVSR